MAWVISLQSIKSISASLKDLTKSPLSKPINKTFLTWCFLISVANSEKSCPLPTPPAINQIGLAIPAKAAAVAPMLVALESSIHLIPFHSPTKLIR